jgi:hypothetical protein
VGPNYKLPSFPNRFALPKLLTSFYIKNRQRKLQSFFDGLLKSGVVEIFEAVQQYVLNLIEEQNN